MKFLNNFKNKSGLISLIPDNSYKYLPIELILKLGLLHISLSKI